jgi:argininosuccinate lyase
MGLSPLLLAKEPERYPYVRDESLEVFRTDTSDMKALIELCTLIERDGGLAGITSSSDYFIATAARLAQHFGLPSPSPEAVELCRHKGRQRARLAAAGVPIPAFHLVTERAAAVAVAAQLGYPVVVKPVTGSGSFMVRLCRDGSEVGAAAGEILGREVNERGMPLPRELLVEQYIQGEEYSVEALGCDLIVGVTAKQLGPPPAFVEHGHLFPAPLPAGQLDALREVTCSALQALGLTWGPSHTELRMGPQGPCLIEVNPRLAGGFIPELIRHTWGVDLVEQSVRFSAGWPLDLRAPTFAYGAIRFLVPDAYGRLESVEGIDKAATTSGVADISIYYPNGTHLCRNNDFRDRLGHVLTTAASAVEAGNAANAALAHLRPVITAEQAA